MRQRYWITSKLFRGSRLFTKVKIPNIQSIEVTLWTEVSTGHRHWLTSTSNCVPFYVALEVNIARFSLLFLFQPSSCVKIYWTVSLRKLKASLQTSECVNLSFKLTDITCIIHNYTEYNSENINRLFFCCYIRKLMKLMMIDLCEGSFCTACH